VLRDAVDDGRASARAVGDHTVIFDPFALHLS
jgi:hypothetical protein